MSFHEASNVFLLMLNYEDVRRVMHIVNSKNRSKQIAKELKQSKMIFMKIKNTYLHFPAINVDSTNSEIHANGVLLLLHEYARLEALDHAGLPHIRVTDQDDFKQKVKRVVDLRDHRLHGLWRNNNTHAYAVSNTCSRRTSLQKTIFRQNGSITAETISRKSSHILESE